VSIRVDGDVGEPDPALGQDAADHVARAVAGAAGGDDQVGPQRLVVDQRAQASASSSQMPMR